MRGLRSAPDLCLAACGWLARAANRLLAGADWGALAVAGALAMVTVIPTAIIGATPYPTDLTLRQISRADVPSLVSWVRVSGDLRPPEGGSRFYRLYDPSDPSRYLVVAADAPLATGPTVVTGRMALADTPPRPGNSLGSLVADVPAVPETAQPWPLILLPTAIAVLLLVGHAAGYPVIRPARRDARAAAPLVPDQRLPARWSGSLRGLGTVSVGGDGDVCEILLRGGGRERVIRYRRGSPSMRRVWVCSVRTCEPALEIHAPSADLVLVLGESDRDRLAASLE